MNHIKSRIHTDDKSGSVFVYDDPLDTEDRPDAETIKLWVERLQYKLLPRLTDDAETKVKP